MAVLIDTSVLIAFERGDAKPDVVTEDAAISVITVSELVRATRRASARDRPRRHAIVEHYLHQFGIVDIIEPIARLHGELGTDLAAAGTTVGTHDLWIAATALYYGFGVITRNARHFAPIPGLRLVPV